jgi:arylsulfatase A-like enzyme
MALAALSLATGCSSAERPPNVLLVTLDTTRPDFFSCYGSTNRTPGFDALARSGVRFELALATSAVTPVSHASILTGLNPYQHGLRVLSAASGFRLPASSTTLAGYLKSAGYATGAVHSAFPVSGHFGFDRDFDRFESFDGSMDLKPGAQKTTWNLDTLQRRSDATTALALEVIEDLRSGGRPFFLWVHYWDPHDATLLPPPKWLTGIQSGGGARSPRYEQVYAAEVRYMDRQFRNLTDGLEKRGLRESTLIALTADHGQGLSDGFQRHGWAAHRMTYQEQIHVPLIFAGPGIPVARTQSALASTVDIVPTLLDLVGIPDLHPSQLSLAGRSLRPLMDGGDLPPASAYADQINGYDFNASMTGPRPDAAFLFTVCDGTWKLIWRPHMPEASELFHLLRDPLETVNEIRNERETYLRLMADLAQRRPWVLAPFPSDGTAEHDGVGEALKALGYGGGDGAGGTGLVWQWSCPEHPQFLLPNPLPSGAAQSHSQDGCERLLVPITDWQARERDG